MLLTREQALGCGPEPLGERSICVADRRCPRLNPSAASPAAKVEHAIAADDNVGVLQQVLAIDRAEVPLARAEHNWDDVHRYLVHQAQRQGLPTDVARRHGDDTRASELFALAMAAATSSKN